MMRRGWIVGIPPHLGVVERFWYEIRAVRWMLGEVFDSIPRKHLEEFAYLDEINEIHAEYAISKATYRPPKGGI